MKFLLAVFFGAGVAAWCYSRIGRRVGYTNTQNVWMTLGVIFVLCTAFFYTILAYVLRLE